MVVAGAARMIFCDGGGTAAPASAPADSNDEHEETRVSNLTLNVNGQNHTVTVSSGSMPLLWVLRDLMELTGTKYGCGIEVCGACTVMMDGQPEYSCVVDVSSCVGKKIRHRRRAVSGPESSGAEGVDRQPGSVVRLLPVGNADVRCLRDEGRPSRQRDRQRSEQPVRVRNVSAHQAGDRETVSARRP